MAVPMLFHSIAVELESFGLPAAPGRFASLLPACSQAEQPWLFPGCSAAKRTASSKACGSTVFSLL
jgi:hypothetical protein